MEDAKILALVSIIQTTANKSEIDRACADLVELLRPLLEWRTRFYTKRGHDPDEAWGACVESVWIAAKSYKPDRGKKFPSWVLFISDRLSTTRWWKAQQLRGYKDIDSIDEKVEGTGELTHAGILAGEESYYIKGAKEIQSALQELEKKYQRKIASKALRAGAKVIQQEAKATAPVKSGALKKAIKIKTGKNKRTLKTINVAVGEKWFTGDEFYAAFVELGHKIGSRKLGDSREEVEGTHTLENAYESKKEEAVDRVSDVMRELLNVGER